MAHHYETGLFRRLAAEVEKINMIDTHEHLQRDSELPPPERVSIARFFAHYAICNLASVGMPVADKLRIQDTVEGVDSEECWRLIKPWYGKTRNTAYFEALRIALRDLYGVEDFTDETIVPLTEAMRREVRPGFTRRVFDRAGIDYAMNNPLGHRLIYNPDFDPQCFIVDMVDHFTTLQVVQLADESGREIGCLDDYLRVIDFYFERDARYAGAFKVGRAYDRTLYWEDVPRSTVEGTFNRLLAVNDHPDRHEIRALEDFLLHYLVRKCGEYRLRMKFHTGFHEGNGNHITNSHVALLTNLFLKYPGTAFDIYHISYPYEEEAALIAQTFPNVTINFCFVWIANPAVGRRALSEMLDFVPVGKMHGFGGDYIFVEGSYGHAVMARREITRVLCEKVEEGRFTEEYALEVARLLLRDNALANFDLEKRTAAFRAHVAESVPAVQS
ncbi:MAG: amidohydrolase family protein [Armatimonadota bacterium]